MEKLMMKKYILPGIILIFLFLLACQNKNSHDKKENISVGDKNKNTISSLEKYSLEQIENEADLFYLLNPYNNSRQQIFAVFPLDADSDNSETQNEKVKYCLYKPDNTGYLLSASLDDDILFSQIGGFIDIESYLLPANRESYNNLQNKLSGFLKDKILLERFFGSYYGCRIIQIKNESIIIITEVPYLTHIIKDLWENKGTVHFISHKGGVQWEAGVRLGIWEKYESFIISDSGKVKKTESLSKKIIELMIDYKIEQLVKSGEKSALFDLFWFTYQYFRSTLSRKWLDNFIIYVKPARKTKDIVDLLKKRMELDDESFLKYLDEIEVFDILDT